jgi:two-component system chemotaxis sensor kinase CheA
VSQLCHRLEDQIAEVDAPPPNTAYEPLVARWQVISSEVTKLLGHHSRGIELDEAQYVRLEMVARTGDANAMLNEVHRVRLEPTEKRLRHFADQAHRIAARLDKGEVVVKVEDCGVRLDPRRWAPFWSQFVHAVRNAIDHGLESADERGGKPVQGTVTLRSREDGDQIHIEIEDDGRGVDWVSVRERALRNNLPCATPEQLAAALFVDGFSTAKRVSDVSGRGIGMGALLAGTRALGGDVAVVSRAGKGTLIRMSFPRDAAFDVHSMALAS